MMYTIAQFDKDKVTALVTFDAVTSLEEKWSANVTTQVVERGFNISDNVTIEPPTYTLSGIVTSYSIFDLRGEITWQNGVFAPRGLLDVERHIASREKLISLLKSGNIVSLMENRDISLDSREDVAYKENKATSIREVTDCIITSLNIGYPDNSSGAFFISLELQQITMATVVTEQLSPDEVAPALTPYYSPKTSSGSSGTAKTSKTDEVSAENISFEQADLALEETDNPVIISDDRKNYEAQRAKDVRRVEVADRTVRAAIWNSKVDGEIVSLEDERNKYGPWK